MIREREEEEAAKVTKRGKRQKAQGSKERRQRDLGVWRDKVFTPVKESCLGNENMSVKHRKQFGTTPNPNIEPTYCGTSLCLATDRLHGGYRGA